MDVYSLIFGILAVGNVFLGYRSWKAPYKEGENTGEHELFGGKSSGISRSTFQFQRNFFLVYGLVVAADWLQGPYMYTLYKDEKKLSESIVALLFATGFISAAIGACFIGHFADRYGRKRACLFFCGMYSASCAIVLSDNLSLLFCGRVLGGLSTTLLFSVFEAWMVADYSAKAILECDLSLSLVFGRMTTLSSVIAIVAGVSSQFLVDIFQTVTAPFLTSIICLAAAAMLISQLWTENYGTNTYPKNDMLTVEQEHGTPFKDSKILSLGFISTVFEGSMYLFVFFWSAALISARGTSHQNSAPPFGLVFAILMNAMMLGSLIFSLTCRKSSSLSLVHMLGLAIILSAASLIGVVLGRSEAPMLLAFCLFEACVGVYYPSMGRLKGQIVQDNARGKVYSTMRLPLNLFVVAVLGSMQEGQWVSISKMRTRADMTEGEFYRDRILTICSGLLIVAYVVCQRYLFQI